MEAEVEHSQNIGPQVHKHPGFPTKCPVPLHVDLPICKIGPVSCAGVRRLCTGPGAPFLCARGAGHPKARVWLCEGVVGCAIARGMIDGVWVWRVGLGRRIRVRKDKRSPERRRGRDEVENDGTDTLFLSLALLLAHEWRSEMLEAMNGHLDKNPRQPLTTEGPVPTIGLGMPSGVSLGRVSFVSDVKPVTQSYILLLLRCSLKMLSL